MRFAARIARSCLLASVCAMFTGLLLSSLSVQVLHAAPQQQHPGALQTHAYRFVPSCDGIQPIGTAHCHAILRLDDSAPASHQVTSDVGSGGPPAGYSPADLQSAYALPSAVAGVGQTIAVVDAYDDPNAEADLAVYRSTFGLPLCTTASGCFRKVNEHGGTQYPKLNVSWAQEISLDLDMVSAICPNCHLILVEAKSATLTSLGAAVNEAAALGATAISNSYGAAEFTGETRYDALYFHHPGIAITASAGDAGYGTQYPAASPYVTAIGGTTLVRDSSTARGWTESAWSKTGSGCSSVETQPSWQQSIAPLASVCSKRAIADIAALADPNTGVAAYDTYTVSPGQPSGWLVFGGTSVSAPIIAGIYALAGNAASVTYGAYPYSHPTGLSDVVMGSNGPCSASLLCTASAGWDGPTGNGTPNGSSGL